MVERVGGRYRIVEAIGDGGMAVVYRAVDESTGAPLALKRLEGEAAQGEKGLLRFEREFHAMARLRHPRIVEVSDYGIDVYGPYYTMELLDGSDLGDCDVPLPAREACAIVRDVASALAYLHARGLIHRDLSPRNVRCTGDGRAKLIDFGLLATAGTSRDVAGTPPLMAPETVRGAPLDHRADLYSLGALAYWLLTGAHAYPARVIGALEPMWRQPPAAPSASAPGIPPALDELVLSLMCQDPLGRPSSAAEVIDRLAGLARLEPAPEIEVTHGYLASASMVGRREEMQLLSECLERAVDGEGGAVLIEAPSGTGKTRLLEEIGLDAKLTGAVVVTARGESAGPGPYALLREIVRGLIAASPEQTMDMARPRADVVCRLFPELRERLGQPDRDVTGSHPAEERIRTQRELAAWILELTGAHPLAVLVDDLQRSDEASAAVLAALARAAPEHPLLLVAALRTDEPLRAPHPVEALRRAGDDVTLRGLSEAEVVALVCATFGDVPGVRSVGLWMYRCTGGSPLHCGELARRLVECGLARYLDGVWMLPRAADLDNQPTGLADAMEERIDRLSPRALALAQTVGVHGQTIPYAVCVRLADGASVQDVSGALHELVEQGVLVDLGDNYRFRHDGLQEAVLRTLSDEQRRALHLRIGEALARHGDDGERAAEVGWHLYRGGDTERGAELLERAGRRLFDAQAIADCIAPLEAALESYERRRVHSGRYLDLRYVLFVASVLSNREAAARHAMPTMLAFGQHCGLRTASRVSRFAGRHLGLVLGISWALLVWMFRGRGATGPGPIAAMPRFFLALGYAGGVFSTLGDTNAMRALEALARPFTVFRRRAAYAGYLGVVANIELMSGYHRRAERTFRQCLTILATDRVTPMRDIDRRLAESAMYGLLGAIHVIERTGELSDDLRAIEERGLQYFRIAGLFVEVTHYRYLGRENAAAELADGLESLSLQLGSMWIGEIKSMHGAQMAYALCRDVLGLKRCAEQLSQWVDDGVRIDGWRDVAYGDYHRERGDLESSRAAFARAIDDDNQIVRQSALAGLAETLLAVGDIEGGLSHARACIALSEHPDSGHTVPRLRAERALALLQAAAGDAPAAARRLEQALEDPALHECPPLLGSLHEALARVFLAVGQREDYERHSREAAQAFAPTRNPALIGIGERLVAAGNPARSGADPAESVAVTMESGDPAGDVSRTTQRLAPHRR